MQQLYEFRDHYFEHNSTDKALLKIQETQEKLKETLNILDYVQGEDNLFYYIWDSTLYSIVFTCLKYTVSTLHTLLIRVCDGLLNTNKRF